MAKFANASQKLTPCAHVTGHQYNLAGFDGIKPIVTADRTGSLARFDLLTGRSRYFFYETQGNYKIARSIIYLFIYSIFTAIIT